VNNLHIITLYKLHNKLSSKLRAEPVELVVSSVSSHAVQQARHSQNAWARHVERVETWRAKCNLGHTPAVVRTGTE